MTAMRSHISATSASACDVNNTVRALSLQFLQLRFEQRVRLGIEAAGRFVEYVEVLAREQACREPEFLRHALGVGAHRQRERGQIEIEAAQHALGFAAVVGVDCMSSM